MALLWNRIVSLPELLSRKIYTQYETVQFPVEVRSACAEWIEKNFLDFKFTNTAEDELVMGFLKSDLVEQVKRKAMLTANNVNLQQAKLFAAAEALEQRNAQDLCLNLKKCLEDELQMIKTYGENCRTNGFESKKAYLAQKFHSLENKQMSMTHAANAIQSILTDLQLNFHKREAGRSYLANPQSQSQNTGRIQQAMQRVDEDINVQLKNLVEADNMLLNFGIAIYSDINEIFENLWTEFLQKFKWSANSDVEKDIPLVSNWYSTLINSIVTTLSTIKQVQTDAHAAENLVQLSVATMTGLMDLAVKFAAFKKRMFEHMMVVDAQCPRVIKKDTKIVTGVQFLAGDRFLSQQTPPTVTAVVLNSVQAMRLKLSNDPKHPEIGTGVAVLMANCGTFSNDKNMYRSVFRNLAISKMIRASDTRSGKKAMGEKFCILFRTEYKFDGETYSIWCCSLPFAYMVHLNQKTEGMATIFWDDSFREELRDPFVVPEEVPWERLIEALNEFIKRETKTTWNLTIENKHYLKEKVYTLLELQSNETMISIHKFCVAHLKPGTNKMSFWDWFYNIIEVTSNHLQEYWNKGYIVGFINRVKAEEILEKQEPQTAMLRFSDSRPGAVSISNVYVDSLGHKHINSLEPFTSSGLLLLGIARRMSDMRDQGQATLLYHYNAQNQSLVSDTYEIFGKASVETFKPKGFKPYLETGIRMVLPGISSVSNGCVSRPGSVTSDCVRDDIRHAQSMVHDLNNIQCYNSQSYMDDWLHEMGEIDEADMEIARFVEMTLDNSNPQTLIPFNQLLSGQENAMDS